MIFYKFSNFISINIKKKCFLRIFVETKSTQTN